MKRCSKFHKGVSLIEVIIAFAVVSIMMTVTLPAFRDHTIRAKVSAGLSRADEAKLALERTCRENHQAVVADNLEAGFFYIPSGTEADYLDRILLGADCGRDAMAVVIWTGSTGAATDPVVEWNAQRDGDAHRWTCRLVAGDIRHVPEECRVHYVDFTVVAQATSDASS
mgnify:CR=1 FL=1